MKSKTEKLLDELVKLHPKYIDLSLDRLNILLKKLGNHQDHQGRAHEVQSALYLRVSQQLISLRDSRRGNSMLRGPFIDFHRFSIDFHQIFNRFSIHFPEICNRCSLDAQ